VRSNAAIVSFSKRTGSNERTNEFIHSFIYFIAGCPHQRNDNGVGNERSDVPSLRTDETNE